MRGASTNARSTGLITTDRPFAGVRATDALIVKIATYSWNCNGESRELE